MDQRLTNTLARFLKLSRFFENNPTAVQSVPALALRVAEFEDLRRKLPVVEADTAASAPTAGARAGATSTKRTDRAQVIRRLVPAMSALNQYLEDPAQAARPDAATQAGEMDLRRPADLVNMATSSFVSLYTKALRYWDALPDDALAPYGQLDKPERDDLRTAALAFDRSQTLPTEVRDTQHNAAQDVEKDAETLALFIKKPLQKAVNLLHDKNPGFVSGFKQANRTDDRRGGHASPGTPTPPPAQ